MKIKFLLPVIVLVFIASSCEKKKEPVSVVPPETVKEEAVQAPMPSPSMRSSMGGYYEKQLAAGGVKIPNAKPYDLTFYENYGVNPFVDTEDDTRSTFAIDVDTASYTKSRAYLNDGNIPEKDAVRTEEFINFFDYGYIAPSQKEFSVFIDGCGSRFGKNCHLLRFGLKGMKIEPKDRKPAVLTFVIDVSGSMDREDRLELVKGSLELLLEELKESDSVGIVIYGSRGKVLMEHKGIKEKGKIKEAIKQLSAEGSTYAEEGLKLGYELAGKAFKTGAINRIILCSDGVANVGETGAEGILKTIEEHKDKGITLSAIGFGMENYNDVLMEKLGDKGNGHYAYVDDILEARRIFVENLTGTLQVIAKDVKIQIEFDPAAVRSYRLLGYENRDVADEDFRNDKVDGGEVGSGHSVTALYEIKLWDKPSGDRLGTFNIRYKKDNDIVEEENIQIKAETVKRDFSQAPDPLRLAACVAEFAELLKESYWAKDGNFKDVLDELLRIRSYENDGKVIELKALVSKAMQLKEAK